MADVWANAPVETTVATIKASTPQGGGDQERGKYAPEKDLLKWGVKLGTNSHWSNLFTNDPPKEGDTVKVWEYWKDENGEKKFVKWFLDADYQRIKGAKKAGFGGGFKPNYTTEQEAMKDALHIAMLGFAAGAYKDKEGNPLPTNSANLKAAGEPLQKIILAAKSPQPTDTPQQ